MTMPIEWPVACRVAVIFENPGADDPSGNAPFRGYSGQHIERMLSLAGLPPTGNIYTGYCINSGGNIAAYQPLGEEVQQGMRQLREDLSSLKPHIVILLGHLPMKYARDPDGHHRLVSDKTKKKGNPYKYKIDQWRGSLFLCSEPSSPFYGMKCIATYSPDYAFRLDYAVNPLIIFDLKRAKEESATSSLSLPQRILDTNTDADEIIRKLDSIIQNKPRVACDIEGYIGKMSCISFATNKAFAFIVPFLRRDGTYIWKGNPKGAIIWKKLATVLEDPSIPKVLQNSLYDRFVLEYSYKIRVRGVVDDTMLSGWEIYCQLEKGLDVQTSIYTREPYYKNQRGSQSDEAFYRYCCMDSAVTLEISDAHRRILSGEQLEHYRTNLENLEPMLDMELRGIRYDIGGAEMRRQSLLASLYESQAKLNALSGRRFQWKGKQEIVARAIELMANKQEVKRGNVYSIDTLIGRTTKPYIESAKQLASLLSLPPSLANLGAIETICDVGLNVDSDDLQTYLYEELNLPVQYNLNDEKEKVPTTDYEALLRLRKEAQNYPLARDVINLVIEIRALARRAGMLEISADSDGRVRTAYNIVGSYTGRVASYTSPTGSGYNLQTIPNYTNRDEAPGRICGDRDLFLADEGSWFFQCDLKGADGWTVAAYCAFLGDPTMLEDYRYGLKPHNIITLILRGTKVDFSDRDALAWHCHKDRFDKDAWEVFACKRVFHGDNYLEGARAIAKNILTDSEGKLWLTEKEVNALKHAKQVRYPGVQRWHTFIENKLKQCRGIPYLIAASGQKCMFFDRFRDMLTKAVAFEPQCNTTFATNKAMNRLWKDKDNIRPDGSRIIVPLHQVHDALCGQFRKEDTEWAKAKIKEYFDNPLVIANQRMVIPYDGAYGVSWGNTKEGTI